MKILQNNRLSFIPVFSIVVFSSCFTGFYNRPSRSFLEMDKTRSSVESGGRVVIHFRDSVVLLKEARVSNDAVSGTPVSFEIRNSTYIQANTNTANRYINYEAAGLISQIDLYTNELYSTVNGFVLLTKEKIIRYDFNQTYNRRTSASNSWSRIFIAVSVMAIVIVLAVAFWSAGGIRRLIHINYGNFFFFLYPFQ